MTYPYPTNKMEALAYAAHLGPNLVAIYRVTPVLGGINFAAVPTEDLPNFLGGNWQVVPPPKVTNLTPAPVIIDNHVFPPSGQVASVRRLFLDHPLPLPVMIQTYGPVTGLPPPSEGQFFIVSEDVARASRRADCLFPADQTLIQLPAL